MTESWQRKSLFEAIARAIRSASTPLLLVLDDAQWADGETLEWVHYFLREKSSSRILIAAGVRSDDERASRPLTALLVDLLEHEQLIAVDLPALSEAETAVLANQLLGVDAAEDVAARIYEETEGHPLYVMEVARGGLATLDRPADLDPSISRLPPRILAAIGSRLEQLSEEATEALEVAAVVGRAFTFEILEQLERARGGRAWSAPSMSYGSAISSASRGSTAMTSATTGSATRPMPDRAAPPPAAPPAGRPGARAAQCRGPRHRERPDRRAL